MLLTTQRTLWLCLHECAKVGNEVIVASAFNAVGTMADDVSRHATAPGFDRAGLARTAEVARERGFHRVTTKDRCSFYSKSIQVFVRPDL